MTNDKPEDRSFAVPLTAGLERLLPCPFCGAGISQIDESSRVWEGMKFGDPISVSVRHWCSVVPGQPSRLIERIGRDRESAIAAWNMRSNVELRGDQQRIENDE